MSSYPSRPRTGDPAVNTVHHPGDAMFDYVAYHPCRLCGEYVRETQESCGAHRYADDSWQCETCWLEGIEEALGNVPVGFLGPDCECCCIDLPHRRGLPGRFHYLTQRVEWVEQAIGHLAAVGSVTASDALHDRYNSLLQELEIIGDEFGWDLTDEEQVAAIEAAEALAERAGSLAADVRGSRASEEGHRGALQTLALMKGTALTGQVLPSRETDLAMEREREAVAAVRRYWRVQGLDAEAAETAAALEIGEARKG